MGVTRNTGPFFLPQSLVARACHRNRSPLSQNDIHVLCPGVRKAQGWQGRRRTAGPVYASQQGESLCRTEWPLHPSCLHNRRDLSLSAYRAGEIREKEFWEKLFSLAKPTDTLQSQQGQLHNLNLLQDYFKNHIAPPIFILDDFFLMCFVIF